MSIKYAKSEKVIGAGRLFFEETDNQGVSLGGGEVYLGDSPGYSLTITTQTVTDMSSDGPVATKEVDVVTQIDRNFSITTKNVNTTNLSMFVVGEVSTVTQAAVAVVDEPINAVRQGSHYQLGRNAANPVGVRGVTAVTVKDDDVAPTTYVLGTDYELDADSGRIHIVVGGAIVDGTNLEVSYTPVANSRDRITSSKLGSKFGRLVYIEDATFGKGRDIVAPFVQLKPTGELPFKSRDSVQQMGWDVSAMTPPTGNQEALYIDGRPV